MELNQFIKWQGEKAGRCVDIEIGKSPYTNDISMWVYDYDLLVGQHVTTVEEIDLEGKKQLQEQEQYEQLKKKFEVNLDA